MDRGRWMHAGKRHLWGWSLAAITETLLLRSSTWSSLSSICDGKLAPPPGRLVTGRHRWNIVASEFYLELTFIDLCWEAGINTWQAGHWPPSLKHCCFRVLPGAHLHRSVLGSWHQHLAGWSLAAIAETLLLQSSTWSSPSSICARKLAPPPGRLVTGRHRWNIVASEFYLELTFIDLCWEAGINTWQAGHWPPSLKHCCFGVLPGAHLHRSVLGSWHHHLAGWSLAAIAETLLLRSSTWSSPSSICARKLAPPPGRLVTGRHRWNIVAWVLPGAHLHRSVLGSWHHHLAGWSLAAIAETLLLRSSTWSSPSSICAGKLSSPPGRLVTGHRWNIVASEFYLELTFIDLCWEAGTTTWQAGHWPPSLKHCCLSSTWSSPSSICAGKLSSPPGRLVTGHRWNIVASEFYLELTFIDLCWEAGTTTWQAGHWPPSLKHCCLSSTWSSLSSICAGKLAPPPGRLVTGRHRWNIVAWVLPGAHLHRSVLGSWHHHLAGWSLAAIAETLLLRSSTWSSPSSICTGKLAPPPGRLVTGRHRWNIVAWVLPGAHLHRSVLGSWHHHLAGWSLAAIAETLLLRSSTWSSPSSICAGKLAPPPGRLVTGRHRWNIVASEFYLELTFIDLC